MKKQERLRSLITAPRTMWRLGFRNRYDFIYDRMEISLRRMSPVRSLNLLKTGLSFFFPRTRVGHWPTHIQVELTSICNLKCPVCPVGLNQIERRSRLLDVSLFEKLMNEVGPYLLTTSLWGWGEPLLHPQLAEILKITHRFRIASLLSTNGQNLDDDRVIEAIMKHPPSFLILAIDGLTDETNSRFRVGSRLSPILEGVKRIAALKAEKNQLYPVLHMRFIVMKHNEHEVPLLKSFARRNKFDLVTVRALSIIDYSEQEHRDLIPDDRSFRAYDYEDGQRVLRDDFVCHQPFHFPTVLCDGQVIGCEQDFGAQLPMGTLSDDVSFDKIWFSSQAAGVREQIRDHQDEISFCQNCPFKDRTTDRKECSIDAMQVNPDLKLPLPVG